MKERDLWVVVLIVVLLCVVAVVSGFFYFSLVAGGLESTGHSIFKFSESEEKKMPANYDTLAAESDLTFESINGTAG